MESLHIFPRQFLIFLLSTLSVMSKSLPDSTATEWDILMRDAKPQQPDAYLCTAYPVEYDEAYIYKFEALAEASTAHHMLLYGCDGEERAHNGPRWSCPPMCKGRSQTIMFAWAKNAPPTALPKGVGLKIGKKSSIKTIVLQVHYAKSFTGDAAPDKSGLRLYITKQKQQYSAGILLMMSGFFRIPPLRSAYPVDISCKYSNTNTLYPFAYRTHAHSKGKVITGYQYNGTYNQIGKGNPQWPQAFYPVKTTVEIKQNDYLAARCTFDSSKDSSITSIGATGSNEMCNFYIMYYTDSAVSTSSYDCVNNQFPLLTGSNFPPNVSVPLPYNAALESEASGHHHHHHSSIDSSPSDSHQEEPPKQVESHTGPVVTRGSLHRQGVASQTKDSRMKKIGKDKPVQPHQLQNVDKSLSGKESPKDLKDMRQPDSSRPVSNGQDGHRMSYDYDNINPRDLSRKNGMNQEYYDDYAANDWREQQNNYKDPESEVELSRNRNKEFDAMNQQLQQQYSGNPKSHHHRKDSVSRQGQRLNPQRNFHAGKAAQWSGQGRGDQHTDTLHSNTHIEKKLVYQPKWPSESLNIGQVGGVSADKDGNVYIFHRASRIWDFNSFDLDNNFRYPDVPIDSDVVAILDKNGKLIREFGKGQFFMPHGIKVDLEGNIWVTDVALHQVFKIPKNEKVPVLTLGQRFKHSEDVNYFCKPTDVAVLSTGEIFVADGYCNGRVMKFSKDGKFLKLWGRKSTQWGVDQAPLVFNIVHSVAVSEKDNLVCAADRENGRIQCFDLNGKFKHIIKHKEFGTKLFAIDYSPLHGGLLYAVNGPSQDGPSNTRVQGFTLEMKNGALIDQWNLPQGLKTPHAICVDPTSESVYVGELDPRTVWKLTRMSDEEAKAVSIDLNLNHHHDDDDDKHDDNHVDAKPKTDNKKKQHKNVVTATPDVGSKVNSSSFPSNSSQSNLKGMVGPEGGLTISMIMGLVLVVPVVLILIVVLVVKGYRSGNLFNNGGVSNKRIFNMQHILGNSHKGFDPLSTEESDHDLDPDDSDHEEYAAPRKTKS